ncbi:MAG TPA: hypothetical protein VNH17_17685 [Streptosporangiaceae bacterium]|nr:hypothetical protein [Streptosporangiaceae bacterium]
MNLATAGGVFAIMASAVVVLGGLVAVCRALWKVANDIRDAKNATLANTEAINELSLKMDGRITSLEARVQSLEQRP